MVYKASTPSLPHLEAVAQGKPWEKDLKIQEGSSRSRKDSGETGSRWVAPITACTPQGVKPWSFTLSSK